MIILRKMIIHKLLAQRFPFNFKQIKDFGIKNYFFKIVLVNNQCLFFKVYTTYFNNFANEFAISGNFWISYNFHVYFFSNTRIFKSWFDSAIIQDNMDNNTTKIYSAWTLEIIKGLFLSSSLFS